MPNTSRYTFISGAELLRALATTLHHVKWLQDGEPLRVPPAIALAIAKNGVYEGKVRGPRVYAIRSVDDRRISAAPSYWDDRAVIRFHTDQVASCPCHVREKHQSDLWDQMLQRVPPPRAWDRQYN